eukprot:CAMPEP_0170591286 /NCGR_PEP_ID=MMETSP0224-20130122/12323_1 /TAXON_ID=285029 /ORGANISM="Togula jolla, Strain CCCM 725" /LENGTH=373 /DNA_ID=CAMNT_0010915141 /DNA_START=56 /DNA_END=1177 /DNA_ORIENTATION=-
MPRKTPSDLEFVAAVLADSAEYPSGTAASMRSMLATGLTGIVAALKEETGEMELPHGLLRLIGKVLLDASAQCLAALKDKEADAAAALVQCEASDGARDIASAAMEGAMVKLQDLKAELVAAKSAEVKEKCSYSEVQATTQSILDGHAALEEQLTLSESMAQAARDLQTGVQDNELSSTADLVLEYLAENGAEQALQAAARSAFHRSPAERHPFDVITLEAVQANLALYQAAASEKVATSAPSAESAQAELLGAWAVLDVARDQIMTIKEAIGEAEQALELASQSFTAAETEAKALRQALSGCLVQQTLSEASAAEINKALAALGRITDEAAVPASKAPSTEAAQDVKMGEDLGAGHVLVEGRRVATAGASRA